jgi:hypothetical protein
LWENRYAWSPKNKTIIVTGLLPFQVGLTFTIDHSGRVAKRPTIKDVVANRHAPLQESEMFATSFMFFGIHRFRGFPFHPQNQMAKGCDGDHQGKSSV